MQKQNNNILVRKSNELTQRTSTNPNLIQNKIKASIIALSLKKLYEGETEITISHSDIKNIINIGKGGKNLTTYKNAIDEAAKTFYEKIAIRDKNGNICLDSDGNIMYLYVYYFSSFYNNGTGFTFTFTPEMQQMILMDKQFTEYIISDYNKLDSVYSQRLYEYFKSVEKYNDKYRINPSIEYEELRAILLEDIKKYHSWKNFKGWCLDPAINEINKKTDIYCEYTVSKVGRRISKIEFSIVKIQNQVAEIDDNEENKENYFGCLLTESEYIDICTQGMKSKIFELAEIKKNSPEKYKKYRGKNNKSDYEILLKFIANSVAQAKAKEESSHIVITPTSYKNNDDKELKENEEKDVDYAELELLLKEMKKPEKIKENRKEYVSSEQIKKDMERMGFYKEKTSSSNNDFIILSKEKFKETMEILGKEEEYAEQGEKLYEEYRQNPKANYVQWILSKTVKN